MSTGFGMLDHMLTLTAFWAGAVTTAIPGIIVQIILIPILVITLEKYVKKAN